MRGKKAFKNILATVVLQIVSIACGFILPRVIITSFGSSINGLVASIAQFLAYISLLDGGIGLVVKAALYKPLANGDKDKVEKILKSTQGFLNKIIVAFAVYVVILCIFYPSIVGQEFSASASVPLIIIIALSTAVEYAFGLTYKLYLQARQETHITSIIQIGTILTNTAVSILLIKLGFGIDAVKISTVVVYLLRAIIQIVYVKRKYKIDFQKQKDTKALPNRWAGLLQHTATVIHENTDVVLLTLFSTTAEISVYVTYMLVINGVKGLVQAFTSGIDSIFGDMYVKGENEAMNRSLRIFEQFYYTIITIIFACTLILITPFITVYTTGITDVEYFRPLFGWLIVVALLFWAVRQPYSAIVFSAGHFKQTNKGSIIEAGLNILISLVLVAPLGLVGVAIGTVVSTLVRSLNYASYASKTILRRKRMMIAKRIITMIVEIGFCFVVSLCLPQEIRTPNSYFAWALLALITLMISIVVVLPINWYCYRGDTRDMLKKMKGALSGVNRPKKV